MSKIALVLGGSGTVGSETAKAFLKEECCSKVLITSRDQGKLDAFLADVKISMGEETAAKLVTILGDPGNEDGAKAMKDKIVEAVGKKIDLVVTAMGFPWYESGPLLDAGRDVIMKGFNIQVFPTFEAWKQIMPLVRIAGGSYVFVSGGGADMFLGPGTGGMTIAASAATAFAKSAMKEYSKDGFVSTEVCFVAGITKDPSVMPKGYTWLHAKDAGRALVSVAIQRKGHVRSIMIRDQDSMDKVIANGVDA